ncbi:serine/threonine-protein kinase [Candidatus Uabimicrobium amorphum]|uniref:non-specific serine/threonine protein kinase n=1 Tax=Uabimicrobium amorphum TaxID=2596890 RepID=A0A5S9IQ42_UABAM|nr:serine/threonine-protein kinase [Candidatus Uabimicrobium amorphum]BBM85611.1 protein kinase [Candidatus Uabimicrobium amorphum]
MSQQENKPNERYAHFIGKTVGDRYQVKMFIGKGGMAIVFKGFDVKLNRIVAIKVVDLKTLQKGNKQRLINEAHAIAQLNHPYIIQIYDIVEEQGHGYIVMQFVDGFNFETLLKNNNFTWKQIATIIKNIAHAVFYAHKKGLIHRDIKTSNILISAKENRCYLMDFGLVTNAHDDTRLTPEGAIVGTPDFMSPEQAKGESIDHRADIYSLGVVMYEALTKERCITATNSFAAIIQIVQEKPIPPREINSEIPPALEAICLKAMEKNREDRYQTALEMVKQLEGFLLAQKRALEEPIAAATPQFQESKTQIVNINEKKTQIVDLSKKKTQIVDLSKTKRNKLTSRNKMTSRTRKSKKYARKHRKNQNEYLGIWIVIISILVILIIVSQLQ